MIEKHPHDFDCLGVCPDCGATWEMWLDGLAPTCVRDVWAIFGAGKMAAFKVIRFGQRLGRKFGAAWNAFKRA